MKNLIFLFVLSLIMQNNITAQGEGNIWYFSNASGVNFNQTCDISDLTSSMNGVEGTTSISDENGNLLFYTNGGRFTTDASVTGTIWNKNHEVMYDMGTTEGGGASASQSSLVIPKPNEPNHYYLFTLDEGEAFFAGGAYRGFSYFEIDMELNGGLGGVIDYQESLTNFPFALAEGMAGVIRPDGNSYWVVVIGANGLEYYLVDENGVNLDHQQILVGNSSLAPFTFSPDGKYVSFGGNVADFDTETGLYSNEVSFLNAGLSPASSTFSPNSRYFYATVLYKNIVYRADMEATDIAASIVEIPTTLSESEFCAQILTAPDGNLYFLHNDIVNTPSQLSFSAVLCPNSENPCIKEDIYTFPFNGNSLAPGLPNFTDHYFMSDVVENGLAVCTDQSADAICIGEEVTLSVNHYLADTYEWSTGETTDSIIITSPGTYTVTVSDGCCNTVEETFEINSSSNETFELEIEGSNILCDTQAITLTANSNSATSYEWSTGNTETFINVSMPGTYSVTVTDDCGGSAIDEIEILQIEDVEINIQGDTEICEGAANTLSAISDFATSYLWSTGSTDATIEISEAGVYTVTVTDNCSNLIIDEIEVIDIENDGIDVNIEGDINCGGQVIASVESTSQNIQWSTGQSGTEIIIQDEGDYSVIIENSCGTVSEDFTIASSEKIFEMPNAFTPDGDRINDVFRPVWGCSDISNFELKIFNRWGKIVYQSTDPMGAWDGSFDGTSTVSDVFIYTINFNVSENSRIESSGDVTLIR